MHSSLLTIVAIATTVSSAALGGHHRKHGSHDSTCTANTNWPGWSKLKHAFIFGDSYTQTGYNATLTQPTPTNPLGNPTYPGYTSSNGPNWVDYLTVKYNASSLLTYNIAYGGATVDSSLVAPYEPTVSSIVNQVNDEWYPAYATRKSAPWTSEDTLFAIFDGINDVGNSWYKANTTALNAQIFTVLYGLVTKLYGTGARNFAFINVPPVDRSPLALANDAADQATEKADILAWNNELVSMAKQLKSDKPDTNVFTVDANLLFTEVLNNPSSFPQTAGYKNTTGYCVAYENGTPATDTKDASCSYPVNQYFWLNSLHPTYPMQDVLAQGVAKQLAAGPNVC